MVEVMLMVVLVVVSRSKEGGGHDLSEVGSVSCSGGNSSGAASNKSCSDVESRNGGD